MADYRIMLIDDDDDVRQMLEIALRPYFEVVEAHDGLEALTKLEMFEPDFAIIDVEMPLMDGFQLCEAIRRQHGYHHMKVWFLTGHGSKDAARKSYSVGGDLFLTKPFDPERIVNHIRFTIEHDEIHPRPKQYSIEQLKELEARRDQVAQAAPAMEEAVKDLQGEAAEPEEAIGRPQPKQGKPRILAVDDDADMIHMISIALREHFEVTHASNGMEAVERLIRYEPDIMLVDIMMPKMNGFQLIQAVRRNPEYNRIPIVVLSAKGSPKDQELARRNGANDYFVKPFDTQRLAKRLLEFTRSPEFQVRPKRHKIEEIEAGTLRDDRWLS